MTHETFTEKISLWLDNELGPAEIAELQTHLSDCATCQQAYQAMQRVDRLFHESARVVVAPAPGFPQRFEARLAQRYAINGGHLWLGLAVLALGTLFFFLIGGVTISTFISAGMGMIGTSILYDGLVAFIESANLIGVWLNLTGLFVKACLITMSQPLFWGFAIVAIGMVWLWLRLVKSVYQRSATSIELFI
jgi:predicted anti-sigma-YlaC factor YlaD